MSNSIDQSRKVHRDEQAQEIIVSQLKLKLADVAGETDVNLFDSDVAAIIHDRIEKIDNVEVLAVADELALALLALDEAKTAKHRVFQAATERATARLRDELDALRSEQQVRHGEQNELRQGCPTCHQSPVCLIFI